MLSVQNAAVAATPSKSTPTAQINLQLAPAQQLAIELPTGLCPLDPKRSEVERLMVTGFERHFATIAKLMSVLAECTAVTAVRKGGYNRPLNQWGGVGALLIGGEVRPIAGATRAQAIEELGRIFALGETDDQVRKQDEAANRTIDSILKEGKSKASVGVNYHRSLGLLAKDDIAAFSGTLMKESVNGKSRMVSGVWGVTLVREYVVLVSLWRPFVNRSTFDMLLSETRAALLSLILLNDKESFRGQ